MKSLLIVSIFLYIHSSAVLDDEFVKSLKFSFLK